MTERFSEHPLFSSQEDRNEWAESLRAEAWNEGRDMGPADLQAMADWMSERWREQMETARELKEDKPQQARWYFVRGWRIRYRLGAITDLLDYISAYGPSDVPEWQDSGRHGEVGKLAQYLDEIQRVLEESPSGSFGDKTSLYRAVSKRLGNEEGACKQHLYRYMDDEPEDEQAWRDYLM